MICWKETVVHFEQRIAKVMAQSNAKIEDLSASFQLYVEQLKQKEKKRRRIRMLQSNSVENMLQSNSVENMLQSSSVENMLQSNSVENMLQSNSVENMLQSNIVENILQSTSVAANDPAEKETNSSEDCSLEKPAQSSRRSDLVLWQLILTTPSSSIVYMPKPTAEGL